MWEERSFFIARENMTSVYQKEEITDLAETAFHHFMEHEEEIIYILYQGRILGVLSIGDLERFYKKRDGEIKVNKKYTMLDSVDYDAAQKFFRRANTVNELPVVTRDNRLIGIIRYEKNNLLRKRQRETLKDSRTGKRDWIKKEISRFVNKTKARVIIYTQPKLSFDREITELLYRRKQCSEEDKWRGLSEEEWKTFWQSEYKDGIVDTMKMERNQCSLIVKNGVASFLDRNGECYSFRNGYRITANNPPNADRKIFMYGPCIIAGAFCKDNQTIASFLQDKLNVNGYALWKVINKGLFDIEYFYHTMFVEELSENDIVIIWLRNECCLIGAWMGLYYFEILQIPIWKYRH